MTLVWIIRWSFTCIWSGIDGRERRYGLLGAACELNHFSKSSILLHWTMLPLYIPQLRWILVCWDEHYRTRKVSTLTLPTSLSLSSGTSHNTKKLQRFIASPNRDEQPFAKRIACDLQDSLIFAASGRLLLLVLNFSAGLTTRLGLTATWIIDSNKRRTSHLAPGFQTHPQDKFPTKSIGKKE